MLNVAPETGSGSQLPARLGHARNETGGGELPESEARNLEPANKRPATPAHLAAVDDTGRAGIARQLQEPDVILLRLELSTESGVFRHRLALAFIAINPGSLRHKGTRKLAGKPWGATTLLAIPDRWE